MNDFFPGIEENGELKEIASLKFDDDILLSAIHSFRKTGQLLKAIEEMAELTVELAKVVNSGDISLNFEELKEETADVEIMLRQIRLMLFRDERLQMAIDEKTKRLSDRIAKRRNV